MRRFVVTLMLFEKTADHQQDFVAKYTEMKYEETVQK